ncbi:MAG: CAP domain-containing protein [Hellea sp.]|nr:CAP domain-containing protein [Hellea sp.]
MAFFIIPHLGAAGTILDGPPIGTYKTVTLTEASVCSELCHAEEQVCRGSVLLQPDITQEVYQCYLNDGLSAGSPFEILPPEPLDIEVAVNDLNKYRAEYGLSPVTLNKKLNNASLRHAEDMARNGMISHTGTDGSSHSDRVQEHGYDFSIAAENVASGQESWNGVFKAWQDSPGHNENLLLPDVTEFGVALVYERTTQYRYYWAMVVASPFPGTFTEY